MAVKAELLKLPIYLLLVMYVYTVGLSVHKHHI